MDPKLFVFQNLVSGKQSFQDLPCQNCHDIEMGAMVYTKICPDCNKSPPSPNSTLTPKILFGTEAGNSFFNPLVWPAKANSSRRRNEEKVFQFPSTTAFKIQKL